ncbi:MULTISPECIES: TIGR04540 family protein [Clostridium]|uniref:Ribonuclease P n=1 Tax=Clostridium sulfidigenes TaxID=318464 RepID=A0A084J986_9CLOT|nr:TIGR04540 family protein [Clostridium sulfidigenes]HAR84313.1 ribonuclease P [Clostridium sp.]KEZ85520.1 ribonuclease P [Clostridium sulfidigenes]MBE6060076.1 TIGR04540 family protein [Clostridium sulfidigenes]HBA04492.1 ribonuclease P [Clostridium sp.]HBL05565.1 ribonuclease P [Clostridium sp.]
MRTIYKNPKELGACLRDIVDLYRDDLMTYEKLSDKVIKIVDSNVERFFKNGDVEIKIANILEEDRIAIIKDILDKNN